MSNVKYNGTANGLTKLVLPSLSTIPAPMSDILRTIITWANNLTLVAKILAGNNITITEVAPGQYKISASGSGGVPTPLHIHTLYVNTISVDSTTSIAFTSVVTFFCQQEAPIGTSGSYYYNHGIGILAGVQVDGKATEFQLKLNKNPTPSIGISTNIWFGKIVPTISGPNIIGQFFIPHTFYLHWTAAGTTHTAAVKFLYPIKL